MIQLVSDVVAVAALGKAGHHAGGVRHTMAALAGRYRLVFVLVTGDTKNILVLGITAGQHFDLFLVTGNTHLVRRIRSHEDCGRHVGLVALLTFGGNHV